ncbi:MAG: DUF1501 domain-containing protein, partial [Verrucomicrobiales bacterium]|nr:DUF1501 domain-containing protein [Verrucomicrobiales bacterium]
MTNKGTFCGNVRRREFLHTVGGGFPALALSGLLAKDGFLNSAPASEGGLNFANPLAQKPAMYPAKAKNVIFLFMYGGPSHIDTFDYKPSMYGMDGKTIDVKTFGRGGKKNQGRIVEPKWKFKQYGPCGKYVSALFPPVGPCV